jgi:phage host-nuclease inhibitor protein Gam
MAQAKKINTPAIDYSIPRDRDECDEFIYNLGEAVRSRDLAENAMNRDLAQIKSEYEAKAAPVAAAISRLTAGIQGYCEAHRAELCKGDAKTFRFGNGEVRWRHRPPKVTLRGVEKILDWCKTHRLRKFIRVTEELSKEAMLADAAKAQTIPGVSIASAGEDFAVEPFNATLEEPAADEVA